MTTTMKLGYALYAAAAYTIGMGALVYLMGFVIGAPMLKHVDSGDAGGWGAFLGDILLLIAFTVPHSIMARPWFKTWWARWVPIPLERSTYILVSGLSTFALVFLWQPITSPVWQIDVPPARNSLWILYALGWLTIVLATFNTDHFGFFGLRQVWQAVAARVPQSPSLSARWLYALVRHPIYLGWFLVLWSSPEMTVGHLLFAGGMSVYIVVVTPIEEADLVAELGDDYRAYRRRVPRFFPWPRRATEGKSAT